MAAGTFQRRCAPRELRGGIWPRRSRRAGRLAAWRTDVPHVKRSPDGTPVGARRRPVSRAGGRERQVGGVAIADRSDGRRCGDVLAGISARRAVAGGRLCPLYPRTLRGTPAAGCRGVHGQCEAERAALAKSVLCPDLSAMSANDGLRDVQPESDAAPVILGELNETIEDRLEF